MVQPALLPDNIASNTIRAGDSDRKPVKDWPAALALDGRAELSDKPLTLGAIYGGAEDSITCSCDESSKNLTISLLSSFSLDMAGVQQDIPFLVDIAVPDDYPQASPPRSQLVSKYLVGHQNSSTQYHLQ